jgi:predicted branched-subunit amino acid permease
MIAWVTPTRRAIRWRPLLCAPLWLLAVGALLWSGEVADVRAPVWCGLGVLAATALLAFDDPAYALLAAMPTSVRRRHGRRVVLVGTCLAIVWCAVAVVGRHVFDTWPASAAIGLAALFTTGLAAMVICERSRPDVAATVGAVVPVVWAVGSQVFPSTGVVRPIAELWLEHPWPVVVTASALAFVAADR